MTAVETIVWCRSLQGGKRAERRVFVRGATNIHWPTDATLVWDTVRVLTRLIGRLRDIVPKDVPRFANRKRAARKRMQKLQRMTASQRETQQVPHTSNCWPSLRKS